MTYKKMSYISGLIIFFSAVTLLWSILWLSGQRIISSSEYRLYFKFADVVGLRDRSQVFMRGILQTGCLAARSQEAHSLLDRLAGVKSRQPPERGCPFGAVSLRIELF